MSNRCWDCSRARLPLYSMQVVAPFDRLKAAAREHAFYQIATSEWTTRQSRAREQVHKRATLSEFPVPSNLFPLDSALRPARVYNSCHWATRASARTRALDRARV